MARSVDQTYRGRVLGCVSWTAGEQLPLLAKSGGRGDGVWETLCQTSQGQRSL